MPWPSAHDTGIGRQPQSSWQNRAERFPAGMEQRANRPYRFFRAILARHGRMAAGRANDRPTPMVKPHRRLAGFDFRSRS